MADKKLSFLFLFIFLVSCSTTNISARASTATETAAPPTLKPISVSTSTMTITPVPSWTPLPPLVDENSFLDFISFTKNGVCKLPCWAGVYPGKSNWDEALFALSPMESIANTYKTYVGVEGAFGKENVIVWFLSGNNVTIGGNLHAIAANQNAVNMIYMDAVGSSIPSASNPSGSLPPNLDLQSVLREYGIPSMVFIYTYIHHEQAPLPLKILLIYSEHQFYITYYREAKLNGNMVVACDPDLLLELVIVDNKGKLSSQDVISNIPVAQGGIRLDDWKPVEQVLLTSPEKFQEIYAVSASECVTFPSILWEP